jgi:hypothetical protein
VIGAIEHVDIRGLVVVVPNRDRIPAPGETMAGFPGF